MFPSPKIILIYHGIIADKADVPPGREPGAELYDVSAANFRQHLYEIRDILDGRIPSYDRAFFKDFHAQITFDDGEMNNFTHALPLLKEYGLGADFFITAGRIGQAGYMGPNEIQLLDLAGMKVGAHGLTHRVLTTLTEEEVRRELIESKRILEKIVRHPLKDFSVPRGFYNERVVRLAREAGYDEIFVSGKPRPGEDVCGRVAVKGNWTLERFDLALRGKTPAPEILADFGKNLIKKILGPAGYGRLRDRLIQRQ